MRGKELAATFLVVLSVCISGQAQRGKNGGMPGNTQNGASIRGSVYYKNGFKANQQGILVVLDNADGGEYARLSTDSAGRFSIENIPAGRFIIHIQQPGYLEVSEYLDLSITPVGTVRFELIPVPSTEPAALPPGGPAASVSANLPESDEGRSELKKGQKLLIESHDAAGSVIHFKRLTETDPRYSQGFVLLGSAYLTAGRYEEAESAFKAAIQLNGHSADAHLGMGVLLLRQRRMAEAEGELQRAVRLKQGSFSSHFELARLYFSERKWEMAEEQARQALAIEPNAAPGHVLLGDVLLRRRNAAAALAEYKEYLRLEPSGPWAGPAREVSVRIEKALADEIKR